MLLRLSRALVYCGKEKGGESGDRPVDATALALFFFIRFFVGKWRCNA